MEIEGIVMGTDKVWQTLDMFKRVKPREDFTNKNEENYIKQFREKNLDGNE